MFKELLEAYENDIANEAICYTKGEIPILLTAVHTHRQLREDGSIKYEEPFTKAVARYVGEATSAYTLIKNMVTGIDSNKTYQDMFKEQMLSIIKENNIKLVIDLHGAKEEREFDIELGTLNNLSADYATINELVDAFHEKGIVNISLNETFKGGGITQTIYSNTDIDVIQLEINRKYRDPENIDNIKKLCDALISYIKQYSNFN